MKINLTEINRLFDRLHEPIRISIFMLMLIPVLVLGVLSLYNPYLSIASIIYICLMTLLRIRI